MTETLDRDLRDRGNAPHLSRTTTILRVAAATAWAHLAKKMGLSRLIPQVGDSSDGNDQTKAVRLRLVLEQLGPSFVKLGQLLNVQRDLIPAEIIAELEKLQEQAASFSFAERLDTLQQHLDRATNRLSFSLRIAAIVVASSIVMSFHSGPHFEGIPLIGLIGYGVAAVLGLRCAVAILRSGKLEYLHRARHP